MEQKREATKRLLAEGLKELMQTQRFEKITIHMITSCAGVIRPTFYNYFQDKYEVLEWIFETDVLDGVETLVKAGMGKDAIQLLFRLISRDLPFYRRAMQIEGQNSFEEILLKSLYQLFLRTLKEQGLQNPGRVKALTEENLALYYASNLTNLVKFWLLDAKDIPPEEAAESYLYLLTHSIFALIRKPT